MDAQLLTLIDLQGFDTRLAALDAEAARLPRQIEAIQAALAEAKKSAETIKAKADTTRKDLRTKEKDLEVVTAKRTKAEGRLWEVKNNTEYSAVLSEIEAIKQEKAKGEEEILGLMEIQERLAVEGREADVRLKARSGIAVASVNASAICGGCRMAIRPQAIQELKAAQAPMICENCGRYLYWQESA